MSAKHAKMPGPMRRMRGFGLIELMIALILGLLVMSAAIGIFLSNRQTFRSTENVGRIQESARVAFELMARDVREAGGNPCVNNLPVVNVLKNSTTAWQSGLLAWGTAVTGFGGTDAMTGLAFGTATGNRVNGTDAIQLLSGGDRVATISAHDVTGGKFTLNTSDAGFTAGNLVIVCNSRQASVFQAGAVSTNTVNYAAGGSAPGNCTSGLGLPLKCDGGKGTPFQYSAPNSVMVALQASRWYVGMNSRGQRSLYQTRLAADGSSVTSDEIVEGVQNMAVTYLLRGGTGYVDAATVAGNWANVIAVRIALTLQGQDRVGTDGNPLQRQLIQVASLRNRNA